VRLDSCLRTRVKSLYQWIGPVKERLDCCEHLYVVTEVLTLLMSLDSQVGQVFSIKFVQAFGWGL